jgi:hypothetical protein
MKLENLNLVCVYYTEFCLNSLVVEVHDLDNSILENLIRHLKVLIKYTIRSILKIGILILI